MSLDPSRVRRAPRDALRRRAPRDALRRRAPRDAVRRRVPREAVPTERHPDRAPLFLHPPAGSVRLRRAVLGGVAAAAVMSVVAGVAAAQSRPGAPITHAARTGAPVATPTATSTLSASLPPTTTAPAPAPVAARAARPVRAAPAPRHRPSPARHRHPAPATSTVISALAANGIPSVALNAYRVAAARMAHVAPSCGIDWALLAGIGREESDHGRFAGAVLHLDGTSAPRIVGPALNGVGSDLIPAPADGRALDGDARYTHALGPMQFIPQTWDLVGTDADGDGVADIFDLDDAALSAARYLCAAGGDLRTRAGVVRAVLAYNHNDTYLAQVLALAHAYLTGVDVSGVPIGTLTGALPPVAGTGKYGVNPGDPTAVRPRRGHHPHGRHHKDRTHRWHRHPAPTAGRRSPTPAAPPPAPGRGARPTPHPSTTPSATPTAAPPSTSPPSSPAPTTAPPSTSPAPTSGAPGASASCTPGVCTGP